MDSESRGSNRIQRLKLVGCGCLFIAISIIAGLSVFLTSPLFRNSEELNVPSVANAVQYPEGFPTHDYDLSIHWFCIEDSWMPMNPTGEKRCGGLDSKSGTHVVNLKSDGSFKTSEIQAKRISFLRRPRFYLEFGLFLKGERPPPLKGSEYSVRYSTNRDGKVRDRLLGDLARLRIIRVKGGVFDAEVRARDSDGSIYYFNELMELFPESYNYSSRSILWLSTAKNQPGEIVSFEIENGKVEIPDFEFLQVGTDNVIPMSARIETGIGLVKQSGEYKYYHAEPGISDLSILVDERLEAVLNSDFFDGVSVIVEVE